MLGDRWTLLVLRDLFCGKSRYGEFVASPEGIPTKIFGHVTPHWHSGLHFASYYVPLRRFAPHSTLFFRIEPPVAGRLYPES